MTTISRTVSVRVPVRRYLLRLGTFLLPVAIGTAAVSVPVLLHRAQPWVLLVGPVSGVLLTLLLLATWPTSVAVRSTTIVVRRFLRPRQVFHRADVATSVFAEWMTGPVWHHFMLFALKDSRGRSRLRIDDKLVSTEDLRRLATAAAAPQHSTPSAAGSVDDLVRAWPFAGTMLHRHYYLTRLVGALLLLGLLFASIRY